MEIKLQGIGVSPGIAVAPVLSYGMQPLDVPKFQVEDQEQELKRFDEAISKSHEDLVRLRDRTEQELGKGHADIFDAHIVLLNDVTIRDEVQKALMDSQLNVEHLLYELLQRYAGALESVGDPRFRERANDIMDVGSRILGKLMNRELESLASLEAPCVVVAHDLSPSDTVNVDVTKARGIATDLSGPTSHTAILARALEIPAVVGLRYVTAQARPGEMIIVDGAEGHVILNPSESTLEYYETRRQQLMQQREALISLEEHTPSVTLDGVHVPVLSNIELPVEVPQTVRLNVEGVGLYRTEYLFLNRTSLPSEDEQLEAYSRVAAALKPHPVTLRTVDLGGDKFVSHMRMAEEVNPQLGWRAIRLCLERPDIFKSQLRAMLRASVHGQVRIMFPMVSGVDELLRVREIEHEVREDLRQRGVPFDENVPVGSMIEVPSAVMVADALAQHCDFFSIGTNDLIQYSLAVDRVNEKVAHLYEPAHPAVIRMIKRTVDAARSAGITCAICGEMAGDPVFTELLLGLGLDSLSMSSVAIPVVRAEVGNTHMGDAQQVAREVLEMNSIRDVRALLVRRASDEDTIEAFFTKRGQKTD